MEPFLIALLILTACILFTVGGYRIGFFRAEKIFSARSALTRPSLKDVTIRGTYRIKRRSLRNTKRRLQDYLKSSGSLEYAVEKKTENSVAIRRLIGEQKDEEYVEKLADLKDGIPTEIYLSFSGEDDETGIDAECRPAMHLKVAHNIQSDFEVSSLKEAQEACSQFMNKILVEALGARVVRSPEPESLSKSEETVVIRDTLSKLQINEKIRNLVSNADRKILVAGWVDRELVKNLRATKGKRKSLGIRVIAQDPRGRGETAKHDFERLVKNLGAASIRVNPRFSDRFIVCDDMCIIGSPSLTPTAQAGYESAIYTNDPNAVKELETQFEEIWKDEKSKRPRT